MADEPLEDIAHLEDQQDDVDMQLGEISTHLIEDIAQDLMTI